jgi:predicted DNA-binding transcriptional regulator AlpA
LTPEILTEREVAETYGFGISYLRRCRRERRGPRFLKIGKLVRYRRADIEDYLNAHAVETVPPAVGVATNERLAPGVAPAAI